MAHELVVCRRRSYRKDIELTLDRLSRILALESSHLVLGRLESIGEEEHQPPSLGTCDFVTPGGLETFPSGTDSIVDIFVAGGLNLE